MPNLEKDNIGNRTGVHQRINGVRWDEYWCCPCNASNKNIENWKSEAYAVFSTSLDIFHDCHALSRSHHVPQAVAGEHDKLLLVLVQVVDVNVGDGRNLQHARSENRCCVCTERKTPVSRHA